MKKRNYLALMLGSVLLLGACASSKSAPSSNQIMVATVEMKEPIPGMCNPNTLYTIIPLPGQNQTDAIPPISEDELAKRINGESSFLKNHPDLSAEGMLNLVVSCEGKLLKCEMDKKTDHPELNQEILTFTEALQQWQPAKIADKQVDAMVLMSFTIVEGKIEFK